MSIQNSACKATELSTAKKSRRVITLDPAQYAVYQKGHLDIVSPEGDLLTGIGVAIDRRVVELTREEGTNILYLLEGLVVNAHGGLELSERAVAGLADMLQRANKLLA